MNQPELATLSSKICSQMHIQIMHSLAHLQDLIPTFGWYKIYISQSRDKLNLVDMLDILENTLFMHKFGCTSV